MVSDDVYSMAGGRWGIMKREYRGGGLGAALPGKAESFRERSGTGWERMS